MNPENLKKLENDLDYNNNYEQKVRLAAFCIRHNYMGDFNPKVGIVLGSGLGGLAESIKSEATISYDDIPYFPRTGVEGHEGKIIIGTLGGVRIIGLKGRKHYYEVAHEPFNNGILQTIFPVHVLAELGVQNYFVTNAAGGLNPNYNVGDIMIIRSHINLLPNPLLGRHLDFTRVDNGERVQRFQPMNNEYDHMLSTMLSTAMAKYFTGERKRKNQNIRHWGTYLAVTGPSYETKGECIAFRDGFKADAVGMSTANEVIAARNRGMNVIGFSCITNKIAEDGTNATNHEEVKTILESPKLKKNLELAVIRFFEEFYGDNLKNQGGSARVLF